MRGGSGMEQKAPQCCLWLLEAGGPHLPSEQAGRPRSRARRLWLHREEGGVGQAARSSNEMSL